MNNRRRKIDSLLADLRHAERQAEEEQTALEAARERQRDVLAAQAVIQETAEAVQRLAHAQIANVVTRCLQAVFGEDAYTFAIKFSQKRGKTEAELLFVRDGQEIDPTEAAGGGVVDVAAFALRLACLLLIRPKRRLFVAMDEPFRFLSADHIPAMRELLMTLARDFSIQFLIVTHQARLKAGKVVQIGEE
jgi:ABC-type phosphonate transport system ATPase subunit